VRAVKGGRSRLVAELLVRAAVEVGEAEQRAELVDRLARCDVAALEAIAEAAQPGTAARAGLLLDAARRADPRLVVQLARHTLRYPGSRARELTLRRVGASGTPAAVALLAAVAGAKGDDAARRLLGIDPERDARALEDTQALAVAVLGGTRHADAIAPLAALLGRSTLLPDKHVELLRVEAARALAALGLPDARRLLEQALEHKKKAIRDAAERALSGRPTSIPPS
jgi:hypothetical protein